MSDDNSAVDEQTDEGAASSNPVTKAPETDEELPQWARDKMTKANNEAAKYRHAAKEAKEQARTEVSAEYDSRITAMSDEKDTALADAETARLEHAKLKAALSVGIPGESASEFADLLKGSTEEELLAHAEKVKELFGASAKPARATDPTQGLDGGNATGQSAGAMLANFVRGN